MASRPASELDNRRWAWRAIGALLIALLVFFGYSVLVSKKMDDAATSTGSSTQGPANTPQDRPRQ